MKYTIFSLITMPYISFICVSLTVVQISWRTNNMHKYCNFWVHSIWLWMANTVAEFLWRCQTSVWHWVNFYPPGCWLTDFISQAVLNAWNTYLQGIVKNTSQCWKSKYLMCFGREGACCTISWLICGVKSRIHDYYMEYNYHISLAILPQMNLFLRKNAFCFANTVSTRVSAQSISSQIKIKVGDGQNTEI